MQTCAPILKCVPNLEQTGHNCHYTRVELKVRLRHFYPRMGLKLGVLKIFSVIKITIVRQVRMLPTSTVV